MNEINYPRFIIETPNVSNEIRKLGRKLLNIDSFQELANLAKEMNIKDITLISEDDLKEKLVYEIIEKHFKELKKKKIKINTLNFML